MSQKGTKQINLLERKLAYFQISRPRAWYNGSVYGQINLHFGGMIQYPLQTRNLDSDLGIQEQVMGYTWEIHWQVMGMLCARQGHVMWKSCAIQGKGMVQSSVKIENSFLDYNLALQAFIYFYAYTVAEQVSQEFLLCIMKWNWNKKVFKCLQHVFAFFL